ncbi:unnamed protein product [Linum tenue]|uniref:Uncharacterized protein n=1 Tax=Linum tenue TaxID=586396 RepID=A0AAV0PFX3_9ROSI|nr:unnamed protein product [Linum tenue]
MEALNAASLTPLSLLPTTIISSSSTHKSSTSSASSSTKPVPAAIHGGLMLLSSLLGTSLAKALTYEEALQQTIGGGGGGGDSGFDVNGFVDSIIGFGTDNPIVVAAGGAAALGVPLVLSQFQKSPKSFGIESAKKAYAVLGEDPTAQLLDIRAPAELRQVGTPDVKGLGKKTVSIAYKGEDKPGFLKKLSLKFKEPENTTLFVLDKFDGNSELVAELVSVNGFKAAYAIKDGAEGPKGWLSSSLPWTAPSKGLSFDLSNLTEALSGVVGEGVDASSLALGAAAAAGLGALAFTEVETLLQLLGSAAIIQFASKKLLFAEDRKETLKQVDEFLTTKVAPKELLGEIQQIGQALLPSTGNSKSLPAPVESSPEATAAEPPPVVNSAPKPEVKAESVPGLSRPLSPYPSVILTLPFYSTLLYFNLAWPLNSTESFSLCCSIQIGSLQHHLLHQSPEM